MYRVELPRLGTFDAWRNHARTLALGGARAEDVEWTFEGEAPGLFGGAALISRARPARAVNPVFFSCSTGCCFAFRRNPGCCPTARMRMFSGPKRSPRTSAATCTR